MKGICKSELRKYMSNVLAQTRHKKGLSQAQFSEMLMIDTRSYSNLEHGEFLCCTLTFILYLVFQCEDVDALIQDVRHIIVESCNGKLPI